MKIKISLLILLNFLLFGAFAQPLVNEEKPNVLFIAVDDLRPELSCFGASQMITPNFDRLAKMGVRFSKAYCQQAVCAPSRNSLMTGLRPDALGIYDLYTFFRKKRPNIITLPQHFKNEGYHTETMGKIYHTGHGNIDDKKSWSVPKWNTREVSSKIEKIAKGDTIGLEQDFPSINGKKLPWHCSLAAEKNMTDAIVADHAVQRLNDLKQSSKPFFLAVGFIKPHLPFVAPKKYWDLYDPASITIPGSETPEGMYVNALSNFGELRKYHGIQANGPLNNEQSKQMIHGYYATVSMIDAQLGKLLDALEKNGLAENTIIVLWGDHGWKLGEYGNWCKHSNMEMDVNAPLFIAAPGMSTNSKTESLAEFVDIYPTLCELAKLKKPAHLEGRSLVPILKNPKAKVNEVAISQYPRGKSLGYDRKNEIMGYSMRTDNYRFTSWQKYEDPSEVLAVELYDHSSGNKTASINLANNPAYKNIVDKLSKQLRKELTKYDFKPGDKNATK
jgi:arylsulfatase A-like enzyme